jgi:hypothetical protein
MNDDRQGAVASRDGAARMRVRHLGNRQAVGLRSAHYYDLLFGQEQNGRRDVLSRHGGVLAGEKILGQPHGITIGELCDEYVDLLLHQEFPFECASIFVWDRRHRILSMASSRGYIEPAFGYQRYTAGQIGLTPSIATTGHMVFGNSDELKADPSFSGRCQHFIPAKEEGKLGEWRGMLGVPLISRGRVFGCVKLENKKKGEGEISEADAARALEICTRLAADYDNVEAAIPKFHSERMTEILRFCQSSFAACSEPLLLYGREGSGKHTIARYIHRVGPRHDQPFKSITCDPSLSQNLVHYAAKADSSNRSSELEVLLSEASGGIVYFDDLTRLDGEAQALFSQVVTRAQDEFGVRVIASIPVHPAHIEKPLNRIIPDLFLGTMIEVPSLRDRASGYDRKERISERTTLPCYSVILGNNCISTRAAARHLIACFAGVFTRWQSG